MHLLTLAFFAGVVKDVAASPTATLTMKFPGLPTHLPPPIKPVPILPHDPLPTQPTDPPDQGPDPVDDPPPGNPPPDDPPPDDPIAAGGGDPCIKENPIRRRNWSLKRDLVEC
jgi:hypothetical protein